MRVLYLTHWYPTAARPIDGIFVRESAKASALVADTRVVHCAGADPRVRELWRLDEERDPSSRSESQRTASGTAPFRRGSPTAPMSAERSRRAGRCPAGASVLT